MTYSVNFCLENMLHMFCDLVNVVPQYSHNVKRKWRSMNCFNVAPFNVCPLMDLLMGCSYFKFNLSNIGIRR